MEIIFEFLFELILEGSFALMEKKKAPMILRILAGIVVFGVFEKKEKNIGAIRRFLRNILNSIIEISSVPPLPQAASPPAPQYQQS